jgi:(1->4)-alpha-D-glucan 1-alpha-D-glucosylmutase
VSRCARANAAARVMVRGEPAPDRHDEYLFYQALLGAWPAGLDGPPEPTFVDRMRAYMQKAVKEAKVHTSWINPSAAYDDAVAGFVDRALTGASAPAFLRMFLPFAHHLASLGAVNSLAQLVLKIASPGVPDFFQGTELWDLTLVDPDNRRSVDFAQRAAWLGEMAPLFGECPSAAVILPALADMLVHWQDGRIKLYCTAAGLHLRSRHADVFLTGDYLPLPPLGEGAEHVTAFARHRHRRAVVAIAPRLVASLYESRSPLTPTPDLWRDLAIGLPGDLGSLRYRNVLTGELVSVGERAGHPMMLVAEVLGRVPAALLVGERLEDRRS